MPTTVSVPLGTIAKQWLSAINFPNFFGNMFLLINHNMKLADIRSWGNDLIKLLASVGKQTFAEGLGLNLLQFSQTYYVTSVPTIINNNGNYKWFGGNSTVLTEGKTQNQINLAALGFAIPIFRQIGKLGYNVNNFNPGVNAYDNRPNPATANMSFSITVSFNSLLKNVTDSKTWGPYGIKAGNQYRWLGNGIVGNPVPVE